MAQDKLELYNRLDADSAQILGILGSMSENSEKIDRIYIDDDEKIKGEGYGSTDINN